MWVHLSVSKLPLCASTTVTTTTAALATACATRLTTSLAGFSGVDLSMGELASADTLVWLAILAETVVL